MHRQAGSPRAARLLLVALLSMACELSTTEEGADAGHEINSPSQGDAAVSSDAMVASDGSMSHTGAPDGALDPELDANTPGADAGQPDGGTDLAQPLLIAYTGSGAKRGVAAGNGELNIGHQFVVREPGITLRELGLWDEGANGLHEAHTVTVFTLDQLGNQGKGTPVAGGSVEVPAGTAVLLKSGFRFAALEKPLALSPGNYAIVAYGLDGDDPYGDGGNIPLSTTGVEHGPYVPFQFVAAASPAFPAGGDANDLVSASFRYESERSPMLRILPLGDSITFGVGSPNAGYRTLLRGLLDTAGVRFQFVGNGAEFPGDLPPDQRHHEGHPAWTITATGEPLKRDGLTNHLPDWLGPTGVEPDVVLMMIGTNDVNTNFDFDHVRDCFEHLVSMISDKQTGLAPGAKLVVAKLVPINDGPKDARCQAYNTMVGEVVSAHAAAGENVRLVDMHSALTLADLSDPLHPNVAGYQKMAKVWFDAIMAP